MLKPPNIGGCKPTHKSGPTSDVKAPQHRRLEPPSVAELLREYHIRPSKRRGQNFLVDEEVYDTIISTATLSSEAIVLEIGPGLGTLTERLAPHVERVVAVEVDPKLANLCRERLRKYKNVTIVRDDILARPVETLLPPAPQSAKRKVGYQIVANIPYNITSLILKKFLSQDTQPASMTLLMQREVAERVTAGPGDMSLLALSVQLYGTPQYIATVPRDAFWPAPAVASAILHITNIQPFPFTDLSEARFWQTARVGFANKRKQLKNSLAAGLHLRMPQVEQLLTTARIAPTARAQELSIDEWHDLAIGTSKIL